MKTVALLLLSAFSLLPLTAQNAQKVQEPEYIGAVFSLDPSGTLTPLEKQQPNIQSKVKAFGYGGAQTSTVYRGARSPIRFKAGQDIQFVFRAGTFGVDPESLIKLTVLNVSRDQRSVVMAKVGSMGFGGVKSSNGEGQQALNFSKYGEGSYKVSPAQPLAPGEYAFTPAASQSAFLFGIDAQ
jgi:hypothetical protein